MTSEKAVGVAERVKYIQGDVFNSELLNERFDIIFADLPFTLGQPADMLEKAFYDPGLSSIKKYIYGLATILTENFTTQAFLCVSNIGQHDLPEYSRSLGLK